MAKKVYDILLGDDGDLLIKNGDLVIGESTNQHQRLLILANKGEFKQSPISGIGIIDYLHDENPGALKTEIRKQLKGDGMMVKRVKLSGSVIDVEGYYK